jgi:diguanylate cyclase
MCRRPWFPGSILPLLILAVAASVHAQDFEAEVVGVDRGDTLEIRFQGKALELILYGIECPAPKEPQGEEARRFTAKTALHRKVRVQVHEKKSPLSVIGSVVLPDGSLLNHKLVQSGLAKWSRDTAPNDIKLQTLEDSARQLGLGLWSSSAGPADSSPVTRRPKPATTRSSKALPWGTLLATVLFGLALIAVVVLFVLRARKSAEQGAAETTVPVQTPAAAADPKLDEQAEAIESSRDAIQDLLQSLSEFVSDLVKSNTSYDDKMKDHKVSIDQAMTMAGLEEIKRLLVREIEAMQSTNESYRRKLDHANATIQDQQEIMERFRIDAKMDFLTRIANRRAFDLRLKEEFERAKRYGSIFSLIMIDIDHFKKVNDVHGHMAGDQVLRLVAQVLEDQTRFNDFVSRYGGEEFAVLLPESTADQGRYVAEKIRSAVEKTSLVYADEKIRITVSAGVGEVDTESETPETLIERVDTALYLAKEKGRNCVEAA